MCPWIAGGSPRVLARLRASAAPASRLTVKSSTVIPRCQQLLNILIGLAVPHVPANRDRDRLPRESESAKADVVPGAVNRPVSCQRRSANTTVLLVAYPPELSGFTITNRLKLMQSRLFPHYGLYANDAIL
jgi:hypothetical protein